jgi:gamma-glutamyl phosphate reductase
MSLSSEVPMSQQIRAALDEREAAVKWANDNENELLQPLEVSRKYWDRLWQSSQRLEQLAEQCATREQLMNPPPAHGFDPGVGLA